MVTAASPRSTTDRPGYLLKRAQAALHAAMAGALREHGATVTQYAVLTALDEEPGLSNADLARRAFVTPQTMNQVLRELEQRHWVIRHPHPGHGRILQTDLTPAGRSTLPGLPPDGRHSGRDECWPASAPLTESNSQPPCAPASRRSPTNPQRLELAERRSRRTPSTRVTRPGGGVDHLQRRRWQTRGHAVAAS